MGLGTAQQIRTKIDKYEWTSWDKLKVEVKSYDYVVLYQSDKVEILPCADIDKMDINRVLELRAFDCQKELHLIKVGSEWRGRIRLDESCAGEEQECYDEYHLIWGKPSSELSSPDNNRTVLREHRGMVLEVPIKVEEKQRAFIKVRNYLSNEDFVFEDFRLVKLDVKEEKEYGYEKESKSE